MRFLTSAIAASVLLAAAAAPGFAADGKSHRVAIQVDQNDPAVMNLALNNASNIINEYKARNEDVEVNVVTYGPGLHMLRSDTSPVQDRIKQIVKTSASQIKFMACGNTKQGMEQREGKTVDIVPEATTVPSGAVQLIELQEKGWAYLRP
ncbi:MAG: DsrE family protein [Rhizobiales bacterium]|nr:DsrE family protein [Hyphomicrobiales bacterium]